MDILLSLLQVHFTMRLCLNTGSTVKYFRLQARAPSYIYVAHVNNWTRLDETLIPSGSGDVQTGAIIPAEKGNIVLVRIVADASYYTAVQTYADATSSTYTKRYYDDKNALKCAEIDDDTCTYIGFKLNRTIYNNGGHIEYAIVPSINDIVITETGEYSTENVVATITPTDASNKNVSWSVDNNIVELNTSGLTCIVTAKSPGTATLTCTAEDTTNGTIKDTCAITVS